MNLAEGTGMGSPSNSGDHTESQAGRHHSEPQIFLIAQNEERN